MAFGCDEALERIIRPKNNLPYHFVAPTQPKVARYTRAMDRLWTPWRYSYITRADPQSRSGVPDALNAWPPTEAEDKHCVFCNMIAAVDYAIANGRPLEAAEEAARIV